MKKGRIEDCDLFYNIEVLVVEVGEKIHPLHNKCRNSYILCCDKTVCFDTFCIFRGFKVGFNSLCALASVNHQHLHAYYLDQELYSEWAVSSSYIMKLITRTT